MKKFAGTGLACALAVVAGCASTPPPADGAGGAAKNVDPSSMDAAQAAAALGMEGYRLQIRKGEEYYCRKQAVTGSRLEVHEVCMTQAQMEKVRNDTQQGIQRMQRPPESSELPNPIAGAAGGY